MLCASYRPDGLSHQTCIAPDLHCTRPAIANMTGELPSSAQTIATRNNRMPNGKPTIAFIGFGEAGHAIASGLREGGLETMAAWDIPFPKAEGTKLRAAAEAVGVRVGQSA